MKLFEFLALLEQEKFPFELSYINWSKSIKVTVDTFSKIEVYEFDETGVTKNTTRTETHTTDNRLEILKRIESLENRPENTWIQAAKELGITFISPYKFTGIDNQEYEATGLLPEFGQGKGVLITSRKTKNDVDLMADLMNNYATTGLNPSYYDQYDRQRIIETLSEWGWIGGVNKPDWLIEQ